MTICAAFWSRRLERAGYDVSDFDNGASAYERLREEPFSLLLTDIVMPEMDGIELARRATEIDPDLKVMFITGFAAVALNPDSQGPATPRCCQSPSICATSSTRSRRCCRRPDLSCVKRRRRCANRLTNLY
jgi:two-component system cell cycle response regulator CpdR